MTHAKKLRRKQVRPVKAWALVHNKHPCLYAHWTFDKRAGNWKSPNERWIRVEIRPLAPRRKKKNTRRMSRRASPRRKKT